MNEKPISRADLEQLVKKWQARERDLDDHFELVEGRTMHTQLAAHISSVSFQLEVCIKDVCDLLEKP